MTTPHVKKEKIALFLTPDVAQTFAVIAAQHGMTRSDLLSHWITSTAAAAAGKEA